MKLSRFAAFTLAAVIGIASLGSSAHAGIIGDIAEAGIGAIKHKVAGPDYSWMGNRKYMDCIKYVGAYGPDHPVVQARISSGRPLSHDGLALNRRGRLGPRSVCGTSEKRLRRLNPGS
jgi:hypothetical protein